MEPISLINQAMDYLAKYIATLSETVAVTVLKREDVQDYFIDLRMYLKLTGFIKRFEPLYKKHSRHYGNMTVPETTKKDRDTIGFGIWLITVSYEETELDLHSYEDQDLFKEQFQFISESKVKFEFVTSCSLKSSCFCYCPSPSKGH
jgi:hypothetical protein